MNPSSVSIYSHQVSGKMPKYTNQGGQLIYKRLSEKQLAFYTFLQSLTYQAYQNRLKKHVPVFRGVKSINTEGVESPKKDKSYQQSKKLEKWITHISQRQKKKQKTEFLILQNITINFTIPCIMDIKLGKKKMKINNEQSQKKIQNSTTNSHNFRINGFKGYDTKLNKEIFGSKYYFQKISEQQSKSHLAYFFYDGYKINYKLLSQCLEIIKQIVIALLSFKSGEFHSSSLLICYDALNVQQFHVKIIDFDQYFPNFKMQPDHNIIQGLKYVVYYLESIKTNLDFHENVITTQQLQLFQEHETIPQRIQKKYNQ